MNTQETLRELKKMGTAQNIKIYRRHGAGKNLYGVSYANLGKLKKKIKIDHRLAEGLWRSKNDDARILALMIADPEKLKLAQAEKWLSEIRFHGHSNQLGSLVAQTSFAERALEKWTKSKKEFFKHCGYDVLATRLKNGEMISLSKGRAILKRIEKEIHTSPNRAKNAMNMALIAIAVYQPSLRKEAITTAKRVGKVEVDHGETSCKTPDATSYIRKCLAHHQKRIQRVKKKKKRAR